MKRLPIPIHRLSRFLASAVGCTVALSCSSDRIAGPTEDAVSVITVTAPRPMIRVGETLQLIATPVTEAGVTLSGAVLDWTSSDAKIATVNGEGRVTAIAPGTVLIVASTGGKSGTLSLSVALVPISTLSITPLPGSLQAGVPTPLTVVARDSAGNVLAGRTFLFASSNEQVAKVGADGTITGGVPGIADIIASAEGKTTNTQITVVLGSPASLSIEPAPAAVYPGTTTPLSAILRDKAGNAIPGASTDWTSSDPSTISISSSGVITGSRSSGTATITARAAGISTSVPARIVFIQEIGTGQFHSCSLDSDGVAYCWGINTSGESGIGVTTSSPVPQPVAVAGNLRFESISVGGSHTCALTAAGTVYCWGWNQRGSLGDGTNVDRSAPVPINTSVRFVHLASGYDQNCAQTADGRIYCWGGVNYASTPELAVTIPRFDSLSSGADVTCGLTPDGTSYCWGSNQDGQLGSGDNIGNLTPVPVAGGLKFVQLDTYYRRTCGLAIDGKTYCWGGDPLSFPGKNSPGLFVDNFLFRTISLGRLHMCGLDPSGGAYCWGSNERGQVGSGTPSNVSTPTPRPVSNALGGASVYSSISAGGVHTCAITPSGVPYCWGRGDLVGTGAFGDQGAPVLVKAPLQ